MSTPLLLAQHGERADDDADNAKGDMDTCDYCQEDRIGGWDLDPGLGWSIHWSCLAQLAPSPIRLRRGNVGPLSRSFTVSG
jgi:hypothetical protein